MNFKKLNEFFPIVLIGLYSLFLLLVGVPVYEFLIIILTYLVYIQGVGNFLSTILGLEKKISFLPKILINHVLGLSALFLIDYATIIFQNDWIVRVLPLILAGGNIIFINRRKYNLKSCVEIKDSFVLRIVLFLSVTVLGIYTLGTPPLEKVGNFTYNPDKVWHAANSYAFQFSFFPPDIHVLGTILKYHFFDEWFVGILYKITGIATFNINFYYINFIYIAVLVVALTDLAKKKFNNTQKELVFLISLLFLPISFSIITAVHFHQNVFLDNNAIGSGLTFFIILFIIVDEFIISKKKTIGFVFGLFIFITAFLSAGFKIPLLINIVLVLLVLLVLLVFKDRKELVRILPLGMYIIVPFIIYYSFFIDNSSSSLIEVFTLKTVSSSVTRIGIFSDFQLVLLIPILFFLTLPIQTIPYVYQLVIDRKKIITLNLTTEELFLLGTSFVGVVLYFLTYHSTGFSNTYFLFSSIPSITLIASTGFFAIWNNRKKIINKLLIIILLSVLVVIVPMFLRRLYFSLDIFYKSVIKKEKPQSQVDLEEKEAMQWLANNSEKRSVFATNVHNPYDRNNSQTDNKSVETHMFYYYTAFSGRQCFVEGTAFGIDNKYSGELLKTNDSIFRQLNISQLLEKNNITYIVNYKEATPNLNLLKADTDLKKVFENKKIIIYQYHNTK